MTSDANLVLAVDVGGTFTDCVAWTPAGVTVAKVPTTADQSEGVVAGSRRLAGTGRARALLHGSTIATNALLERKGADTVLVTDPGFEDVLEIGRQDRPSLYDPFADRAEPLVARDDRWGWEDPESLRRRLRRRRPESVAVSMAYSYLDQTAEEAIAAAVGDDLPVSVSHRVVGEFREFERTSTTVLNAYLTPRVAGYLRRMAEEAGAVADTVQIMRSSGGLMHAGEAADLAAALLVSGPAGGVVAAARLGQAHQYGRVVAFDMGGTSTDVCRIEGGVPEIAYQRTIEGFVCRMPSVGVHTVGAGGGSIGWVDPGGSLRVGPRSAGADPGPASYGRGGTQPTVTDAHVALGRIDPAARLGGSLALQPHLARRALAELAVRLNMTPDQVAGGMLAVVEAHMERAIRAVSVQQGVDPRSSTLVAYGGAGGLHATALARRLGMARVAIPAHAGVFSALGLLLAPPRIDAARSVDPSAPAGYQPALGELRAEVVDAYLAAYGRPPSNVSTSVDMRYRGQSHEITVPLNEGSSPRDDFHRLHAEINGFARPGEPVEAVTARVAAQGEPLLDWDDVPRVAEGRLPAHARRPVAMGDGVVEAAVWHRSRLPAGAVVAGPAVVEDEVGTIVLAGGESGLVTDDGTIEVTW